MKLNIFNQRAKIPVSENGNKTIGEIFGANTLSSITMTNDKAMKITAVGACIKAISEGIGQISVDVYQNTDNGSEKDVNTTLQYIIHNKPNQVMTSVTFHEAMAVNALKYGNAYARIWRDKLMNVTELQIIQNEDMTVYKSEDERKVYYKIEGVSKYFDNYEILHIKGLSDDGFIGIDPISQYLDTLGLAAAEQMFASKYFANGGAISGIITKAGKMSIKAIESIRKSWDRIFGGVARSHKTAFLDDGMEYKPIGSNAKDAQLIESRKFSVQDIARIFKVPLHMIGDLERSTNNNIEQQSLEFVKYTLLPWIKKFEQEYNDKLFKEVDKGKKFIRFNVESLLRGDTTTRTAFYLFAVQNGILNSNEIRQMEGFNKREGGDVYLTPMNMTTNPESNDDGTE